MSNHHTTTSDAAQASALAQTCVFAITVAGPAPGATVVHYVIGDDRVQAVLQGSDGLVLSVERI